MKKKFFFFFLFPFFLFSLHAGQKTCIEETNLRKTSSLFGFLPNKHVQHSVRAINRSQERTKSDKVKIIFETIDFWSDSSGYQLLLDRTHNTFNRLFSKAGMLGNVPEVDIPDSVYAEFECKIPTLADGKLGTRNILYNSKDSLEIEAGIYDFCVVNPSVGQGAWIVRGDFAAEDDFYFEAGYTYRFYIGADRLTDGDFVYSDLPILLSLDKILHPLSGYNLSSDEKVVVRVKNEGHGLVSDLKVAYSIDGGKTITEERIEKVPGNTTVEYQFSVSLDFTDKNTCQITSWLSHNADPKSNDDTNERIVKFLNPVDLPFVEQFFWEDVLRPNFSWVSEDANNDGLYWTEHVIFDANHSSNKNGSYCCFIPEGAPADDYLFSPPIRMKSGAHHLSFSYAANYEDIPASISVLIGTSQNVQDLKPIYEFNDIKHRVDNYPWLRGVKNFEVEKDSIYYIVFKNNSLTYRGNWGALYIDSVMVSEGSFQGKTDIAFRNLYLPASSCHLNMEAPLGLSIYNAGSSCPSEVYAELYVNGKKEGTAVLKEDFAPAYIRDILFTERPAISSPGNYEIVFKLYVPGEQDTFSIADYISFFESVSPPLVSDLSKKDSKNDWAPLNQNKWVYQDDKYLAMENGEPLVSRCFELDKAEYRFSFDYTAGAVIGSMLEFEDNFYIAYGLSGTDISAWDTIVHISKGMAMNETQLYKNFIVAEKGIYSIAIIPIELNTLKSNLAIFRTSLLLMQNYDIRNSKAVSTLARIVPSSQVNGKHRFSSLVRNMGKMSVSKICNELWQNGQYLNTSDTLASLALTRSANVTVADFLKPLPDGSELKIELKADMKEMDGYRDDNIVGLTTLVSDSTFAHDKVDSTISGTGVGSNRSKISLGNMFYVAVPDTLTSISIGLGLNEEKIDNPIEISVYPIFQDTILGAPIAKIKTIRGKGGKYPVVFNMPNRILDTGYWFFEIRQESEMVLLDVSVDYEKDGLFFVNSGGKLVKNNQFGNIAIRPNFGHKGNICKNDILVFSIPKPTTTGVYSPNERVKAIIENNGTEVAKELSVFCRVGSQLKEFKLASIDPYVQQEIDFTMDLSATGKHTVEVYTSYEKDQNRSNDTLSLKIESQKALNPYKMTFEQCQDFAISNFNPAWTTFDGDQANTYGFQYNTFPNSGEKFAFIAFNPILATPALEGDGVVAYEGEKYGAVFSAIGMPNDDWLISPKVFVGTSPKIKFQARSLTEDYGKEMFNVLVSTTNDEVRNFKKIGKTIEVDASWTPFSIPLTGYENKEIYVAVQCVSSDAYVFMIDDIEISSKLELTDLPLASLLTLYPNPSSDITYVHANGVLIESVKVYNLMGVNVYSSPENLRSEQCAIPVKALAKGLYLVELKTNKGTHKTKLIVGN